MRRDGMTLSQEDQVEIAAAFCSYLTDHNAGLPDITLIGHIMQLMAIRRETNVPELRTALYDSVIDIYLDCRTAVVKSNYELDRETE